MTLWLAVTADEYELPFCVGDSDVQLAHRLTECLDKPVSVQSVREKLCRDRKRPKDPRGKKAQYRIVKVEVD